MSISKTIIVTQNQLTFNIRMLRVFDNGKYIEIN